MESPFTTQKTKHLDLANLQSSLDQQFITYITEIENRAHLFNRHEKIRIEQWVFFSSTLY